MKYKLLSILMLILVFASCVQPTQRYEVEFELMIPMGTMVESVSIHGEDSPLSWRTDTPLRRRDSDSLYTVKLVFETGYLFTEYKYKLNDVFELKDQDNRRIQFKEGTQVYRVRDTLNVLR